MFLDEASYSLTHYFTLSWTSGSSWSDYVVQNCAVNNSNAFYLIASGPGEEKEASRDNGGSN